MYRLEETLKIGLSKLSPISLNEEVEAITMSYEEIFMALHETARMRHIFDTNQSSLHQLSVILKNHLNIDQAERPFEVPERVI